MAADLGLGGSGAAAARREEREFTIKSLNVGGRGVGGGRKDVVSGVSVRVLDISGFRGSVSYLCSG